ncbi:MAG: CPBP family intramembrane glutamic endopeptidase [Ginsengibacter sp.]
MQTIRTQTAIQKITNFFLIKIIIGILTVGGSVVFVEFAGRQLLEKAQITGDLQNVTIGLAQAAIALLSYVLLFRYYEKRRIKELRLRALPANALLGCLMGLILQSLIILVLYVAGGYSIASVNPVSFLIPGFIAAITAGFVAEIMLRGILFRLTEEKLGTLVAVLFTAVFFAVIHAGVKGATVISVLSTSFQAGVLYSAVYVYTRSLWFPVFLHFAWDFAEPAIYGGINAGITLREALFTSRIEGPQLLTGGQFGPGNSIQSSIFCLVSGLVFLWLAKRKKKFIKPFWANIPGNNKHEVIAR